MPTYEALAALGLSQRQIETSLAADSDLADAWLVAVENPPPGIKNPIGWMLAGIKQGDMPPAPGLVDEQRRHLATIRAENYIRNAGYLLDREDEAKDALFGEHGYLRHYPDPALETRLLALWRTLRPKGEQVEADYLERAARYRASHA